MELEKAIQSKIKKALEKDGWIVLRPVAVSKSGYPDLWCLKAGMLVLVEVKRPGEHPTELQLIRHDQLRKAGFPVVIASSVNHIEVIKNHLKPNL